MKIIIKSWMLVLLFAFIALPQNANQVIETAVAKLQQKVLLEDKQAEDIKDLLSRNISSLEDNKTGDLQAKVEGMLDARQKAKYSIIQNDWWSALVKDLSQVPE